MKTINLVFPDKSDIKYKISSFPDGQGQITITKFHKDNETFKPPVGIQSVQIKSRLNNFKDLELIICATKSLRELGVKEIHLYTPYFLGSRSDRKFEEGSNNYLKDVICPIINSLDFESVTVLDPHSHVLEACLNNYNQISNKELVQWAFGNNHLKDCYNNSILVSPDAGASHKIYKLAEQIGYKGDIITCSKERDSEGKLTKTVVPEFDMSKDMILIDDIGDGFGTFINIARIITHRGCKGYLHLIVTHSIQEQGLIKALEYFDNIYTTNSIKAFNIDKVKQLNVF